MIFGKYKWMGVLALLMAMAHSQACSVPVFRYALERWEPDPYTVQLSYQGTMPEPEIVKSLQKAADQKLANFIFTSTQGSGSSKSELPWLSLEFPASAPPPANPAWAAPFNTESVRLLLDSPARRELVRRLIRGDSTVWILLDGDEATTQRLDTQLRKLEKEMHLPPPDPNDSNTNNNSDLKIAFSVLPMSRTDPDEKVFISLLLHSNPELTKTTGPIAFPIFGRGRLLKAIPDEKLNVKSITETSDYICGSCSCEIKRANPGIDLLLAADWEASLTTRFVKEPPLPPLVSLATVAAPTQAAPTTMAQSHSISPITKSKLQRNLISALVFLVLAVIIGTLITRKKP